MSLQLCPPEIIAKALGYLDGYSLAKCRQVCRFFSGIIKGGTQFQYTIESCKAGMVDAPETFLELSTWERLDKLREFVAQRQGLVTKEQLSQDAVVTFPESFRGVYHSGVFVVLYENQVGVVHPTDLIGNNSKEKRAVEERRIHIATGDRHWNAVCVDRDQDLMIILDGSYHNYEQGLRFDLLSITSGAVHPLASLPFISWNDIPERPGSLVYQILEDLFVVSEYIAWKGPALIFNWKTGHRLIEFTGETQAFVLLNSKHFLTCTWVSKDQCELQVHEIDTSKLVIRLSLPRILKKRAYFKQDEPRMQLCNGALPLPSSSSTLNRQCPYPFYASSEDAIIALWIQNSTSDSITIIRHSDLFDIIHTSKSSVNVKPAPIPWGTWPQATFLFRGQTKPRRMSAYGRRLAIAADKEVKVVEFDNRWLKESYATRQANPASFTTVPPPSCVQRIYVGGQVNDIILDEDFVVVVAVVMGDRGLSTDKTFIFRV
ncbi:hypothetical protein BDN72DRAFT_435148 [Pluteus cervinus]|uniref:Uncharacterized protein n=1 Tax=Pluteus cervinus TaxID=181527 RepID=A0ACD3A890_9AGAR|nr:hypothetical protein BDN72DRAFT_435148 [Pluteus cervinus]